VDPNLQLGAIELRDRLAAGALRATELVQACLAEIERREPDVGAWAWLDGDHALQQARALDDYRASGRPIGPLHGLPVGIKDIIDTAGIPTENGTIIDAGRVPGDDAFVVSRLRQAGAVILGKTVTSELAYRTAGKTRNPHDPSRTPGGSSSGSAAAVAACMVPLALGTQTAGSVIRPASFCGVVGYKPTFGRIPRTGVLMQAASLDTIGTFARSVEDAALVADPLFGYAATDPATRPLPAPRLLETAMAEPPVGPALAFVHQPGWDRADAVTRDAFAELSGELDDCCDAVDLPAPFADALHWHEIVQKVELAKAFHRYAERGHDRLSPAMQAAIDGGRRIAAHDYLLARDWPGVLEAALDAIFDRYDAILTPAAPGPAPRSLDSTGDPVFNRIWTFCGLPAVTLPLLATDDGLPLGVQLVGRRGDDGRLLRTARWLVRRLTDRD
jgi:Asp-tRNA(Asn)/Glu-tRNA(Gln) amidotransferase A subunit family amidase